MWQPLTPDQSHREYGHLKKLNQRWEGGATEHGAEPASGCAGLSSAWQGYAQILRKTMSKAQNTQGLFVGILFSRASDVWVDWS